jgi:XTP/dITP diphosphohydrolase
MAKARQLVIATNNRDKVEELRQLLDGCGWQVLAPSEAGVSLEVEESGETYFENARLKAEAFARASGRAALADDSGLEVDALNGEPGALHHRRGWDGRDQPERIQILLHALREVPPRRRTARFRAVIVVVLPDEGVLEEEGTCEGLIVEAPAGSAGFGYDPVFFLPGLGRTMAELTLAEKNEVSHRAAAAAKMKARLLALSE